MSEQALIDYCAPTLAGLKTANLFVCDYDDRATLMDEIRAYNERLRKKGLAMVPVRIRDGRAHIYIYRPAKLACDLGCAHAKKILAHYGYDATKPGQCVARLGQRLADYDTFPHEIGLFLGYPPEDVEGFIRNKGCGGKCIGCWKVYGDAENAQKCFDRFKKCTRIYKDMHQKGKTIDQLAVRV